MTEPNSVSQKAPEFPELLRVADIRRIFQVVDRTLYRWEKHGKLKPIRVVGRTRS